MLMFTRTLRLGVVLLFNANVVVFWIVYVDVMVWRF